MTTTKKRSMFTTILIVLGVIIAAILLFAATRPDDFRVSRSTTIAAPASAAFPYINETKKWEIWNPWGKLDPNMKLTYDGPAAGAGRQLFMGRQQSGRRRQTDHHREQTRRVRPLPPRFLQAHGWHK